MCATPLCRRSSVSRCLGAPVERQHEEVHRKAQRDDGKAGVADDPVGHDEHHLKQQLERLDEQRTQNVPE